MNKKSSLKNIFIFSIEHKNFNGKTGKFPFKKIASFINIYCPFTYKKDFFPFFPSHFHKHCVAFQFIFFFSPFSSPLPCLTFQFNFWFASWLNWFFPFFIFLDEISWCVRQNFSNMNNSGERSCIRIRWIANNGISDRSNGCIWKLSWFEASQKITWAEIIFTIDQTH